MPALAFAATNMSLLKNIIQGTTPTDFVLIKDKVDCTGQPLLLAIIKELINSHGRIDLFCLDPNTLTLLASFGLNRDVNCHIMYADPGCWDRASDPNDSSKLHYNTDLLEYLKNLDSNLSDVAVVLDSLSSLILNNDLSKLCRTLKNVIASSKPGSKKPRLVGLLHDDCHDYFTLTNIEYLASCVICLQSRNLESSEYVSSIVHKSVGGKITKETIQFAISKESLAVENEIKHSTQSLSSYVVSQEVHQLASKLTFSVSLKTDEKQSRAQLVLPYEKMIGQSATTETGQILYVPDEADDFDEEDPDDDLNI